MHIVIRILGTAAVTALLTYPLWSPEWGTGLLGEIVLVPFPGNLLIIVGFLGLVAWYCASLQQTLRRAGAARPASVWWMFAIPANFVEDFYIVDRVSDALRPSTSSVTLLSWTALGYGWCGFQILSLFPGPVGVVSGGVAIVLWLTHWVFTLILNRRLR
ncbi:hypothetical protein JRI60_22080 [Archangium violaceum]|uniref:hypothetical protein n=1 Tax=Archangium violaceum TaxID=83451 RepID=UPI00194F843B|nr:hypothetical protein [Archangium violaceum]QRO01514.1 hypothetical protein JRI60_22080 [Archangium violaceum]